MIFLLSPLTLLSGVGLSRNGFVWVGPVGLSGVPSNLWAILPLRGGKSHFLELFLDRGIRNSKLRKVQHFSVIGLPLNFSS